MGKTLEQLILALPCDGATTLAIIGALREAGLADATVYGEQESSLLAAAEAVSDVWHRSVITTPPMTDAMLELDAAIAALEDER